MLDELAQEILLSISLGSEYVPPPVSLPTVEVKKELAGALLLRDDHGEDQPEDDPHDVNTDSDDDLPWPGN